MPAREKPAESQFYFKATGFQRKIAAVVSFALISLIVLLHLSAVGHIDHSRYLNPCGFQIRHNLPCPTCGITRAMLAFGRGDIFDAFYIQPAGGVLALLLFVSAFFTFIIAVFGVYFRFLENFFRELKVRYIILAAVIVFLGGWAVTLARALAAGRR